MKKVKDTIGLVLKMNRFTVLRLLQQNLDFFEEVVCQKKLESISKVHLAVLFCVKNIIKNQKLAIELLEQDPFIILSVL